jgi:membrane-associated PAP2 superfamily phosphatase
VFLPLILAALASALLAWNMAEVSWQARYYRAGEGWWLSATAPVAALYKYGPLPAQLLALAGLAVFVVALMRPQMRRWWRAGLFVVLALGIGPGLVVNSVLKEHWNRPRPRHLREFGGDAMYRPAGVPGPDGEGRNSFPSGHASMGFFLMTPYFILRHNRRLAAIAVLVFGVGAGLAIGWARVCQGGHFPSDVLWAGAIVYATGAALAHWLDPMRGFGRQLPSQALAAGGPAVRS